MLYWWLYEGTRLAWTGQEKILSAQLQRKEEGADYKLVSTITASGVGKGMLYLELRSSRFL